jgi:hypothetical protein
MRRQNPLQQVQPNKRGDSCNWPIHPTGTESFGSQTRNERLLAEHRPQFDSSTKVAVFPTKHGVTPNTLTWLICGLEVSEMIDQKGEGALIRIKPPSNLSGSGPLSRTILSSHRPN